MVKAPKKLCRRMQYASLRPHVTKYLRDVLLLKTCVLCRAAAPSFPDAVIALVRLQAAVVAVLHNTLHHYTLRIGF